jgi:hypothetical protein
MYLVLFLVFAFDLSYRVIPKLPSQTNSSELITCSCCIRTPTGPTSKSYPDVVADYIAGLYHPKKSTRVDVEIQSTELARRAHRL